jgi:hypothetical protein
LKSITPHGRRDSRSYHNAHPGFAVEDVEQTWRFVVGKDDAARLAQPSHGRRGSIAMVIF